MKTARHFRSGALGAGASGFSLIEVLIALIIIAVGMLGLAKIQALAYTSTGTASLRSLAALEASSFASAMHANRSYWSPNPVLTTALTITITGTTIVPSDAALSAMPNCAVVGTPCSAANLAAYDLQKWVGDLNALLPNLQATVNCPVPLAGPMECTIQLTWNETQVAINAQAQGNSLAAPTYTLYVAP